MIVLLVCVRLFDGNFARRGYCFFLGGMVVMFALVGGTVVFLVLGAMVVLGLAVLLRGIVLVLLERL